MLEQELVEEAVAGTLIQFPLSYMSFPPSLMYVPPAAYWLFMVKNLPTLMLSTVATTAWQDAREAVIFDRN